MEFVLSFIGFCRRSRPYFSQSLGWFLTPLNKEGKTEIETFSVQPEPGFIKTSHVKFTVYPFCYHGSRISYSHNEQCGKTEGKKSPLLSGCSRGSKHTSEFVPRGILDASPTKRGLVLNCTLITKVNRAHWQPVATLRKPTSGSTLPTDDSGDN